MAASEDSLSFICPITNGVFEDPVKAEDGITYEREGIKAWFASCQQRHLPITSPSTRKIIGTILKEDRAAAQGARRMQDELSKSSRKVDIRSDLDNVPSIHDLRKMFATLDPLRSILEKSLDGWQPPQLVVIGQESSGKSTLLERLAMMPIFPQSSNFCTRLPIHVRLRNTEKCQPATLEVFNVRTNVTEEQPYVIPTESGAVYVREKMQDIIAKEQGDLSGGVSLERIIILTIRSPYVPSIDLIDMPGLVASPDVLKESTRKLVEQHIHKHDSYSLYLVTVCASEAPKLSEAIHVVQSNKLQDRTIGVFTMCDETVLIERRKRLLLDRFESSSPSSSDAESLQPHGWVCMMNKEIRMPSGCTNLSRLKQQALAEEAFMREHMSSVFDQGKAGCCALMQRLNDQFLQFMTRTWGPKTIKLLDEALQEAKLENAILGLPAVRGGQAASEVCEMVSSEATRRVEVCKKELVHGCCREVLQTLKTLLTSIVSEELVKVDPTVFPGRWKAQRERFQSACKDAVDKWGVYWVKGIIHVLQKRRIAATSRAGKKHMIDYPAFELDRFPAFLCAAQARVEDVLEGAKASVNEGLGVVAGKHYGACPQWMSVTTELGDVPSVSVTCDVTAVVDNVVMCFIHGNAGVLEKVGSIFASVCRQVADSDWIESCTKEREALLLHIERIQEARKTILEMFGEGYNSQDKIQQQSVGQGNGGNVGATNNPALIIDDDEDCQFIKGCYDPQGIAVDTQGLIYVVDALEDVIKVFSTDGPNGTLVRQFGSGYLSFPVGVAVDDKGTVFVCSTGDGTISVFSNDGTFLRFIGSNDKKTEVFLSSVQCVAVDSKGIVYVTDPIEKSVCLCNQDGKFVERLKLTMYQAYEQLGPPFGIAIGSGGNFLLSNMQGTSLAIFDKNNRGFTRSCRTGLAEKAGVPCQPGGIDWDRHNGHIYVARPDDAVVNVFTPQAVLIRQIACESPRFVAFDAKGTTFVSERDFGIRVVPKKT